MQQQTKNISKPARNSFRKISRNGNTNAAAFALACAICQSATAQTTPATATTNAPVRLPEITVQGRDDSLVGVADSATQGVVGAAQLARRPVLRPGEILETVPGVIITQHSGAGKANQYFLRGFNLDHGTDFATWIEGMPLNLPTHAHGQGYTDLNSVIPELVQGVRYEKGPYYAEYGDFASAGAAEISYARTLPASIAKIEGGTGGYGRGLFASSPKLGDGNLLYAIEVFHNDGPWVRPDDYQRFNGTLRYSAGNDSLGWSAMLLGYHGKWNATDQLAERAVNTGLVDRFGTLDSTTGGNSQRYSLLGEWHRADADSATKVSAFGAFYDLDLFSNFTYFLDDPVNGDQFEQQDRRYIGGANAKHTWFGDWNGRALETSVGLQIRHDAIDNGLYHTVNRTRLSTTRADRIAQTSVGFFAEHKTQWAEKFRSTVGLRGDYYHFDVNSDLPANSGTQDDFLPSPKLGVVFGPWAKTELYANGGLGFHSNDGRGATTRIEPGTGAAVTPVDPLVRSYGAEIGVRTTVVPGLQSSVSLWWLDIDSELLFVGDAGTTSASRPSRRYGVEFANYYNVTPWLTLDADFSLSQARFRDQDPAGNYIPGSIAAVVAAGVSVHDLHGFFGELRVRYFGPRALIEDNSRRSAASTLLNGRIGYEFNRHWSLALEVFNILDSRASDIDYFYTSRLAGEAAAGVDDKHFHPAEPRTFRVSLTAKF